MNISKTMKKTSREAKKMLEGMNDGHFKERVARHIKEGREKISLLEGRVQNGKGLKELQKKMLQAKKRLSAAREKLDVYEKKAEKYVEKNPKKALVIAAAAGVLAGRLWSEFIKKPVSKGKKAPR